MLRKTVSGIMLFLVLASTLTLTFDIQPTQLDHVWFDYDGIDSNGDGIGDTPYVIDENNQDNYPLAHPVAGTTIYVDPPTIAKTVGPNFTASINIADVTGLCGWQARLRWNPDILNVVSVTEGEFLRTGGTTFLLSGPRFWNQTEGWIFFGGIVENRTGVSGEGTLANVTFHSVSIGECVLDLCNMTLFSGAPATTPPYWGDINGDMIVNILDAAAMADPIGTSEGDPGYDPNADFNTDGVVDLFDFLCVILNFGRAYPEDTPYIPTEIIDKVVYDGYVATYNPAEWLVTWKWLDSDEQPVWFAANVTASSSYPIEDFTFNRSLGQISLNFTSAATGFCNLTIPKLLMDGSFKVLINDTQVSSMLTWNKTHTSVYFNHDQGTHNVAVIGEIVTRIRALDLLTLSDLNGDGIVNMEDLFAVARRYQWTEDP